MEKLFNYNNSKVRTIIDEKGDYWFAGIDVCYILEYAMPSNIIKDNLDEDERMLTNLADGSGQTRKTWTINESGLYSLILSSTKPEAKAFKRWITHEVLPELRKAGKYSTEAVAAKDAKIQELIKKIESKEKDITNSESTTKNLKKELNILQVELRMTLKKDPSQTEVYPPEVWNNLKHPLIEEN